MVLEGVIGEMLFAFGEHDAVDLGIGVFAGQRDVLIDFGEAGAEGADGPLQLTGTFEDGFLMGEVPDAGAPVLQVDVAELRARADDELDGAAV